jgi:hypothetical protein
MGCVLGVNDTAWSVMPWMGYTEASIQAKSRQMCEAAMRERTGYFLMASCLDLEVKLPQFQPCDGDNGFKQKRVGRHEVSIVLVKTLNVE